MVIPGEINGYPVTAIGRSAFSENTSITSVVIGEGVTSIEYSAFSYCSSLKLTVPAGSWAEQYAISNEIPYVSE